MTAETVDVATAGSTLGTTTSLICIGRGVVQPLDFLVNKSFTFNCKRQTSYYSMYKDHKGRYNSTINSHSYTL